MSASYESEKQVHRYSSANTHAQETLDAIPSRDGDATQTLLHCEVAQMIRLLTDKAPNTTSSALTLLGNMFPATPLRDRIKACEAYARSLR